MTVPSSFFTEVDPRAATVPSRDPVGAQVVWSAVGRQVIGNLTLSSRDVAGFRTLLLGYLLPVEGAPLQERLHVFLRWEQYAAYCRLAARDRTSPLGARKAQRAIARGGSLTLSAESSHQILADQRSTGLWTLYHRAAVLSGLATDDRHLTDEGRALVEPWATVIPDEARRAVLKGRPKVSVLDSQEATDVALVLVRGQKAADRVTLRDALLRGRCGSSAVPGTTWEVQEGLAQLEEELALGWEGRVSVHRLRVAARAHKFGELDARLRTIEVAESVLQPAQALFDFVLRDGHQAPLTQLAAEVKVRWPGVATHVEAESFVREVVPLLPAFARQGSMWDSVAETMARSHWRQAIDAVITVHEQTVKRRGGRPWVSVTGPKDVVTVHRRQGRGLPDQAEILAGWLDPFYLPPFMQLHRDLASPKGRL